MENIIIKDTNDFNEKDLEELFLSVDWSSGHYPDKLKISMKNFKTVYSAWCENELVGLISVMDDGIMNAYIHYLLVKPSYQGKGIGKKLVECVKEKYEDYLRLIVIAYDSEMDFYKNTGFEKSNDSSPMFITDLWT